ncbi:hypothetical protein ACIP6T_24490 [Pantoea sp. NPDC088449]|uniref:hypothetical protein n=1 Tax=Pantoea sp. NPDC088449 TaxID=3364392 RepID=UPI0038212BB4
MSSNLIGNSGGVDIYQDNNGMVYFTAKAAIDADGANGQNGKPGAYREKDTGLDFLANGGMKLDDNGVVVIAHEWGKGVALTDSNGQVVMTDDGTVISMTAYHYPNVDITTKEAYVDSATVPYIAVPTILITNTKGIVLGCRGRVTSNGVSVDCVVADNSGSNIGEISIAAAEALGINANPRHGGDDEVSYFYEIWPDEAAPGFKLQPS